MRTILSTWFASSVRPNRRWLQFTTRGALVSLTIFCVWLGSVVNATRRQAQAVLRIKELGGWVRYDTPDPYSGMAGMGELPPRDLAWYERCIGEEYFRSVIAVKLELWRTSAWGDADLVVLRDLPALQQLTLENTSGLSDAGLQYLRGLKRLESLKLESDVITGSGFPAFNRMSRLQSLTLITPQVFDAGLSRLPLLPSLRELHIEHSRTSDASLAGLAKFTNLERLQIDDTDLADEGLAAIARLKRLQHLCIHRTLVTPRGVVSFRAASPNCEVEETSDDRADLPDFRTWPKNRVLSSAEVEKSLKGIGCQVDRTSNDLQLGPGYSDPLDATGGLPLGLDDPSPFDDLPTKAVKLHVPQIISLNANFTSVRLALPEFSMVLRQLPMLLNLEVQGQNFTDLMAQELVKSNGRLLTLNVSYSWITDRGLDSIGQLTLLQKLNLDGMRITDDGLRRLANGPQLRFLSIRDTSVTNASVPILAKFQQLEDLHVGSAKLTPDGIADLKRRLPKCRILTKEIAL